MKNRLWILVVVVLFAGVAGAADQLTAPGAAQPATPADKVADSPAGTAVPGRDDDCDGVNCASNQVPEAQGLAIKEKGLPGKSSSKKENEAHLNHR